MKIIHNLLMWTKTDNDRIFLMTENPYKKRHKSSRKSRQYSILSLTQQTV
jgi:hypothetical protein